MPLFKYMSNPMGILATHNTLYRLIINNLNKTGLTIRMISRHTIIYLLMTYCRVKIPTFRYALF